MIPPAASQGTIRRLGVELLPGEERPEDERAERSTEERAEEDVGDAAGATRGRVHVGGRGPRQQDRPLGDADQREPEHDDRRGLDTRAKRCDETTDDAGDTSTRENGDPAVTVHQPPGRQRRECAGREEDRRAEAQDPFDARDEDERDGGNGNRQLDHAREARQGGREQDGVPADRKAVHKPSLSERRNQPSPKRCRTAVRGVADVRPAEPRVRDPADRDHLPAVGELGEERRARFDLDSRRWPVRARGARVRRHDIPEEDVVSIPSSASTEWTMVAVASAGPVPVSWRSEVRGMPEMRVPR